MPEYAAKFRINGLLVSGIEMPEREEVDKDFAFRNLPSEPEAWIAFLRFKTKEKEEWFTSKAYSEAKKRLLNFISIHSVSKGFSATIDDLGVSQIRDGESLLDISPKWLTIEVKTFFPENGKQKVLQREYTALKKSIEMFKTNESILRNNPCLVNAIHYFWYSDLTERDEEKLIDLIISLETLYLTERLELAYRLSLRVASLIGHFYKDKTPEQIAMEIKALYNKRSRVVHGDPEEITSSEMSNLKDYACKSIQMFIKLSLTMNKRGILKLIDDSLFNEKIRDSLRG